jgi:NAD(P)H dehydrogenase (quinone)
MSENKPTLLVTGASGHLGRRVVELLLEANAGTIVAATRSPEKLADFASRGVIVRKADFDDPASLDAAFQGVDRLLLISTDAFGVPGYRLQQHRNAVAAADKAGVNHVVYTSLVNPGPDSPVLLAPDHQGTEDALAASSLGWTVLRENIYAETLLGSLGGAVQMGKLFNTIGDGRAAYITREDCARACAAALAATFAGRRTLDITGPEAVSQADLARIASDISGQPVEYVPLQPGAQVQNLVKVGLPQPIAELLVSFDTAVAQGRFSAVSSAVEDLTGRKPQRVADFLAVNKPARVPGAVAH